ncbi:hypothetical protein VTJ04DRAFT_6716 [Mycothermus thermophilus]|uniref:uncharacterized protein n=1 Tax=Humicola insolens TaxID=85995 RepID=UPI003744AA53
MTTPRQEPTAIKGEARLHSSFEYRIFPSFFLDLDDPIHFLVGTTSPSTPTTALSPSPPFDHSTRGVATFSRSTPPHQT